MTWILENFLDYFSKENKKQTINGIKYYFLNKIHILLDAAYRNYILSD